MKLLVVRFAPLAMSHKQKQQRHAGMLLAGIQPDVPNTPTNGYWLYSRHPAFRPMLCMFKIVSYDFVASMTGY